MRHAPAVLYAAGGVALAIAGWMLVSFWCPYGVVASMMTGRIPVPGLRVWLPYPWVLMSSVCLLLYAVYLWAGLDRAKPALRQPLLFGLLGVGVAAIGFLDLYYPCPVRIDLPLLLELAVRRGPDHRLQVDFGAGGGAAGLCGASCCKRGRHRHGECSITSAGSKKSRVGDRWESAAGATTTTEK
jgi:hypothetical protein